MQLQESISNPIKSRPPSLKTPWSNLSGTSVFPQGSFQAHFNIFFPLLMDFIYALFDITETRWAFSLLLSFTCTIPLERIIHKTRGNKNG